MKNLYLPLNILLLLGINSICQGQDHQVWEIEKHEESAKKRKYLDSMALQERKYLPAVAFRLKSQFPIQHAVGLEFSTSSSLSGYIGVGQLSRAYVVTATDFLPDDDSTQATRKQLIKDKLQNGFVFELGLHYHILKWRDMYVGLNLQFQRFTLTTTPKELVEKYDFGDTQGFSSDIQDLIENNSILQDFYENTILEPVISPIQLGITVGKRFHFKKAKRLFLDLEFSYQFNISNKVKVNTDSFIGQVLVNNFVDPILQDGSSDTFGSFNLPALTLGLSYQLGKKIHHKIK